MPASASGITGKQALLAVALVFLLGIIIGIGIGIALAG
jgi:hypothetical protein